MIDSPSSLMPSPTTVSSSSVNVQPKPNDVLSGRGNSAKNHNGNLHFRKLVESARDYYVALPPNKKILVSQLFFGAVKSLNPPGRFLKEKEKVHDLWEELEEKDALAKTSQALREGQPEHKKSEVVRRIASSGIDSLIYEVKVSCLSILLGY